MKKSAWFQRKQSSLLPLPTERTKTRLQSFGTFITPLCIRSKLLQKYQLSELALRTTLLGWIVLPIEQYQGPPCKVSDHRLEQLRYIVTAWCCCSLTACNSPTSGKHHGEMEPSHPPLSFATAELWDLLNQTCRVVWPHYARRRHKKKKEGERDRVP